MKTHDWVIAILVVTVLFIPLALPYQFQLGGWAESTIAWVVYFLIGASLTIVVFFAFLQSWRHLMSEMGKEDTHE